jgi:hypothetical protein
MRSRPPVSTDIRSVSIPFFLLLEQDRLGLTPGEINVLLHLLAHRANAKSEPYPTNKVIAHRMGLKSRSIQRHLTSLEKIGLIKRLATYNPDGGLGANDYDFSGLDKAMSEPDYLQEVIETSASSGSYPSKNFTVSPYRARGNPRIKSTASGAFSYITEKGCYINEVLMPCEPRVHDLIGLLMAEDKIVTRDQIASYFSYQGSDSSKLVSVYLNRAKKAAMEMGAALPVMTLRGRGIRWVDPVTSLI